MKNGFTYLKNTAQFGIDLIEFYKNTEDAWAKNNALLTILATEDILDRGRAYCDDSEQKQEINTLMDLIRGSIAEIRDGDPESFKILVNKNSDRLKLQF